MPTAPRMIRQPPNMIFAGRMKDGNQQVMLTVASSHWQRSHLFVNNPTQDVSKTVVMRRGF